ncbi:hypothetical protein [Parabacteroides sp.]|uniref:hypothetical protein n=1 Tax=Parabacteroides sp. TaxID=1869337 RepID=UPI002579C0C1|nr:hypothetical protein [Parabacteroides sp.]
MSYILNYSDEIIERKSTSIPFRNLEDAKKMLKKLKDEFVAECDFMDCIMVELDTPTHYEATDGEGWINIQIAQTLD